MLALRARTYGCWPPFCCCSPYCNLGGGVLTLDAQGDSNAVFIFVTSGYLAASPASQMALVNGARADHGKLAATCVSVLPFTLCSTFIYFLFSFRSVLGSRVSIAALQWGDATAGVFVAFCNYCTHCFTILD
jgi:hypothetical protein